MCKAWEEQKRIGRVEDIMDLLEEIGETSSALEKLIMEQTDLEVLRRWHKLAAKAESIEAFEKAAGLIVD
ncbi:MAG: hypothetical protein HFH76_13240 [Lachnospiraceae bacterium]|nr:hypothetical protein [Lachnospiraceae bacterium]